jgi:uncharacterized protein
MQPLAPLKKESDRTRPLADDCHALFLIGEAGLAPPRLGCYKLPVTEPKRYSLKQVLERSGKEMKAKSISNSNESERTFALVFQTGDEIVTSLEDFAKAEDFSGSHFTAIGALSDVTFAWFDWDKKRYEKAAEIREQVEVLSLIGDIALAKGKPKVHAHIVIGKRDGTAHGGHLMRAHVRPTLEVILAESAHWLRRKHDPESGLALIRI